MRPRCHQTSALRHDGALFALASLGLLASPARAQTLPISAPPPAVEAPAATPGEPVPPTTVGARPLASSVPSIAPRASATPPPSGAPLKVAPPEAPAELVTPPAVGGKAGPLPLPVVVTAEAGKGVTMRREDDSFSMTLRGRLQLRDTVTVAGKATNELAVRTVRLVLQGHALTPDLRYFVQFAFGPGDYEPGAPTPLFDAWVEYVGWRDAQVRVGQFFVPFDRARTIREHALQLIDRQQVVVELNLDRDVGLMVSSNDLLGLGGRLAYAAGVFGGQGRNRTTAEKPGFLWVGRASVRPFGPFSDDVEGDLERLPRPRLAVGVAAAYNENTKRQRSTTGETFVLDDYDYAHAAADLVFKYQGFSFLGEALWRRAAAEVHVGTVDGESVSEWSRSGYGYLAQAGLMLSRHVEAAARWNELFAYGLTDPAFAAQVSRQGREASAGVNLYLNGHYLKLQADFTRRFGEAKAGAVSLLRFQFDGTF
ncbi:MAG: porin [Polyangiaceae bacterium]|nr:porin [Polyangiaceae bacterium]